MLRDRYEPMDLFAFVPKLSLEMDPVLSDLDCLLDDDTVFQRVRTDLRQHLSRAEATHLVTRHLVHCSRSTASCLRAQQRQRASP